MQGVNDRDATWVRECREIAGDLFHGLTRPQGAAQCLNEYVGT